MKKKSKSLFYVGGCSGTNSPTFPRNEFGNLTTAFGILTGKRGVFIDNGSGVGKVSSYLMENEVNEVYGLQTHFHLDHRLLLSFLVGHLRVFSRQTLEKKHGRSLQREYLLLNLNLEKNWTRHLTLRHFSLIILGIIPPVDQLPIA